jgi:hypothetical protein
MYAVTSTFLFSNVYSNRKRANNRSQISGLIILASTVLTWRCDTTKLSNVLEKTILSDKKRKSRRHFFTHKKRTF